MSESSLRPANQFGHNITKPSLGAFETVSPATLFHELPEDFLTTRGHYVPGMRLAFETWGALDSAHSNAIVIFSGLSSGTHVAANLHDPNPGWWEGMVGPAKWIDTDRWFVIAVNTIGSCFGSSGPASINGEATSPFGVSFPTVQLDDTAHATQHLLSHLNVEQAACVIGTSMGAMTALSFVNIFPNRTRSHVNISGALIADPYAVSVRALQRQLIRDDPRWNAGSYDKETYPEAGLRSARKVGLLSYRSREHWQQKFGRRSTDASQDRFEMNRYLDLAASKFALTFDPNSYLCMSAAIDSFDVFETRAKAETVNLHTIQRPSSLVIGVDTDVLFPIAQQQTIYDDLRSTGSFATFVSIDSGAGHDAFLIDIDLFGKHIKSFVEMHG